MFKCGMVNEQLGNKAYKLLLVNYTVNSLNITTIDIIMGNPDCLKNAWKNSTLKGSVGPLGMQCVFLEKKKCYSLLLLKWVLPLPLQTINAVFISFFLLFCVIKCSKYLLLILNIVLMLM